MLNYLSAFKEKLCISKIIVSCIIKKIEFKFYLSNRYI